MRAQPPLVPSEIHVPIIRYGSYGHVWHPGLAGTKALPAKVSGYFIVSDLFQEQTTRELMCSVCRP